MVSLGRALQVNRKLTESCVDRINFDRRRQAVRAVRDFYRLLDDFRDRLHSPGIYGFFLPHLVSLSELVVEDMLVHMVDLLEVGGDLLSLMHLCQIDN
jgi:hypothetical protein